MHRYMRRRATIGRTAGAILALLRFSISGSRLALAWSAAYRRLKRDLKKLPEQSFRRTMLKLERDGFVAVDPRNRIRLTAKGHSAAIARRLGAQKIPVPQRWDGLWRIVSFDVPERDRARRTMLRECLHAIGLVPIQQSVFAHKADCRAAVGAIAASLNLEKRIFFCETYSVDGPRDLDDFFDPDD